MDSNGNVIKYRVDLLDESVDDHEKRLRELEKLAVRIGAYATLGSGIGGAIVALIMQYVTRR